MKKRLLITSIVMMLVVAVALSTATYAWFTTNDAVTAQSINLTAATNQDASLGISWVDGNYGTYITAVSSEGTFAPAAPVSLVDKAAKTADDSLTLTTTDNIAFKTASAKPANGGTMVFAGAPTDATAYTWSDASHNSIFLKNMSPSRAIDSITMSITVTDGSDSDEIDATHLVRVGVFVKNGANYELLKVLALEEAGYTQVANDATLTNGTTYYKLYLGKYVVATPGTSAQVTAGVADYEEGVTTGAAGTFFTATGSDVDAKACYGTITSGANVNTSMSYYTCDEDVVIATNLAAGGVIELKVLVWEDAVALGDLEGGQIATVSLSFEA